MCFFFFHTVDYLPAEIVIEEITTTTVTVSWGETESPSATSYNVQISQDGVLVHSLSRSLSQTRQYTFTSLTPGTLYTVLISVAGTSEMDTKDVLTGILSFAYLTRSIQDSETSIDFVQGPPGSRREWVKYKLVSLRTTGADSGWWCKRLCVCTHITSVKLKVPYGRGPGPA